MRWHRGVTILGLVLAWTALAVWQYLDYQHERRLALAALQRQAAALENAVEGGIRSHRRLGRFFEAQLQGALEELVDSQGVLGAAIGAADGKRILAAGESALPDPLPADEGDFWQPDALVHVSRFALAPDSAGGPRGSGPAGRGDGGGGRGWGRGPWRDAEPETASALSAGGDFVTVLVLDRTATDAQVRGAAWLRVYVVGAGAVVLASLAVVWGAMVRLVEARGRARLLEAEARHLRDLGQAAAGLAHETRNPLGLLRGWTQRLAQSDLQTDEARQRARAVVEECDRLTARINQFLAFARPCEPNTQSVPLEPLVAELRALLEPDLDAKELKLDFQPSPDGPGAVQADREMLRQAIFNLTQNAIQSSPRGATVEISLRPGHDGRARLEVADRGPGVAPQAVPSLFSPYFTTRSDGAGLGLAIVRRIATAHGWQAGYSPRPDGGAVFWIDRMQS